MKKTNGWKVLNSELRCRGFQFEVGKRYKHKGEIVMCQSGFHFHENRNDLFAYYDFDEKNRVCEVVARNKIETDDNKSVTNDIEVIRELSWSEVLSLVNTGSGNSGWGNSGYRNSGDRNSGDRNSGDRNSGDGNSGYRNSGDRNSGDRNSGGRNSGYRNSGDRNSGDRNSGDRNSGDGNSGDWNSGLFNKTDYCSGIFNSREQKVPLFNGATHVLMSEFRNTDAYSVMLRSTFPLTEWVWESNMTDQEKKDNPEFYVAEGYLKANTYEYACKMWWKSLSNKEKKVIQNIDGFKKSVFKEVTGIIIK